MQDNRFNNEMGFQRNTQPNIDKASALAKIYMNNERQNGQMKSGNYQLQ